MHSPCSFIIKGGYSMKETGRGNDYKQLRERVMEDDNRKYHEKNRQAGKMFARERIAKLLDEGSFVEDGLFANVLADDLPADGVITGIGKIDGRPVCVLANDSTVKAGSWGKRTVEKMIRIQETADKLRYPLFYL